MKVLKRPMFRYGGDVRRQGIMHGMNGLRNGGMATTMADATGYANGGITMFPPMRGRVTRPGGYAGEVPNFYRPELDERSYANQLPVPQKKEMTLKDKIFRPARNPIDFGGIDRKDPQVKADLDAVGGNVQKYYANKREQDKIAEEEFKSNFTPASISASFDTEEGPAGTISTKTEMEKFLETEGGDRSGIKKPTLSKEQIDKKRLKRIYDIMGVKDAGKDAVYDALIDLSQGQGIDTKDISGSINRAVGALSKRYDKVDDLKDKAKGALASGTITEMFRDKGSNYGKVARELVEAGVYKTYPEALKAITKVEDNDIGKAIGEFGGAGKAGGGKINDKIVSGALSTKFSETYKGDLGSKKEVADSIAKGTFTDVIDIVTKSINVEPGDKSKDGLYKVGLKVVRVTNGKPSIAFNY